MYNVEGEGSEEYAFEDIVSGPNADGLYEVKWDGYCTDENTWEPSHNLPEDALREYLNREKSNDDNEVYSSDSDDDNVPLVHLISLK